jgi:hypothetical protein
MRLAPVDFQDDRVALPAAGANGRDAKAPATAAQLVDEGAGDPGAGGADGMPKRDRAAVHVDLLVVHAQHPHGVDRDRGERLVDLPEVDVRGRLSDPLEGGDRGVSEWTLTGTTTDGMRLEVRGCDLWTFRGDEVVVKNSFWKIVE